MMVEHEVRWRMQIKTTLKKRLLLLWVSLLASSFCFGEEGVVVLSDTVTGNQEQPKVLYIVPWQAAHDDTILYQPLETKLQRDVFAHIERQEHIRELKYLNNLSQTDDKEVIPK